MQFGETFSSWMSRRPHVYRIHKLIDVVERSAPICRLLDVGQRVLVRLSHAVLVRLATVS